MAAVVVNNTSLDATAEPTEAPQKPPSLRSSNGNGSIVTALQSLRRPEFAHRPLLTHLNADTSWLLQLPYPPSTSASASPAERTHFNILIDPWLQGPQSDVASWFSTQHHTIPSAIATIADLNAALREVEGQSRTSDTAGNDTASFIDLVVISHEFTDHCHRATLEELPPNTCVFAADLAAELIRSWKHFDSVITIPKLDTGVHWSKLTSVGSLPDWIGVGRLISPGNALYYHAAVAIAFNLDGKRHGLDETGDDNETLGEAVIYTPHGINSQDLEAVKSSGVQTLALLHGLHDVRISFFVNHQQLNLGALNGIRAVGASGAKYWIPSHDEVKTGGGLIGPLLRRTQYTLKDAVTHEHQRMKREIGEEPPAYEFKELGSGEGLILV